MKFEGSRRTLRELLATDELRSAFVGVEELANEYDRISAVAVGSDNWELKLAEKVGIARGLRMALDTILALATEENEDDG